MRSSSVSQIVVAIRVSARLLVVLAAHSFLTSCADFTPGNLSVANSSLSSTDLAIKSAGANAIVNQVTSFTTNGLAFTGHEAYQWSHTLNDSSSGAVLTPCTETNGHASQTYSLTCTKLGTLTVKLVVTDGASTYGPVYSLQAIQATTPTPTPTPTPAPTGPNAAGSQLYASSCAGCHGSLARNNVSNRTVSGLNSAISNVGQMRNISLTSTQIQEIVNALNGK